MNWRQFIQLTVNGLTLGCVYALIALGYTMVYGILKLLNFAHGDVYMIGAYIGFFVYTALGAPYSPSVSIVVLLLVTLLAAAIGCAFLGVAIDRFAYKPLRNAPRIAPLITALGVSFLLENSAQLVFGAQYRSYNTYSLDGGKLFSEGIHIHGVSISLMRIIVIVMAVDADVRPHRVHPLHAAREGEPRRRLRPRGGGDDGDRRRPGDLFGLLHRLRAGGHRGRDDRLHLPERLPHHGLRGRPEGLHGRGVGGIGSIPGAMFGGIMLGLAESYADGYLPQGSTFTDVWVFFILIAVMLLAPTGLLGKAGHQASMSEQSTTEPLVIRGGGRGGSPQRACAQPGQRVPNPARFFVLVLRVVADARGRQLGLHRPRRRQHDDLRDCSRSA